MHDNRARVLAFIREHRYAVEASVSGDVRAQAAVIGFAIDEEFNLVFDTLRSSRKFINLRANPAIAFVFGGAGNDDVRSVQLEGDAEILAGPDEERFRKMYLERFPDGAERAATSDVAYFRVKPRWARFSDFSQQPPLIVEFDWR